MMAAGVWNDAGSIAADYMMTACLSTPRPGLPMPVRAARISPASSPPSLGLVLFAWFVRKVGLGEIWSGLAQVGWGFVAIIALAGLRFAMRALAWTLCLEPPHTLPFGAAFAAVVAGDAVGNLTPLGLFASEPAKAAFVRDRVPLGPAVTALAIENIFYTLSAAAMIGAATIALLITFDLPPRRPAGGLDLARRDRARVRRHRVAPLAAAGGRQAGALARRPQHLPAPGPRRPAAWPRGADLHVCRPARGVLVPLVAAEGMFHVLGVLEVYLTWWLIQGTAPPLLTAFIFEGVNRLVQVLFKFVPLRTGVDELTTGSFTEMLGFGAALGTTLAIVRKIRTIAWVLVGTSLLIRKSLRPR